MGVCAFYTSGIIFVIHCAKRTYYFCIHFTFKTCGACNAFFSPSVVVLSVEAILSDTKFVKDTLCIRGAGKTGC